MHTIARSTRWWLVALVGLAAHAGAAGAAAPARHALYKCLDAAGVTSIQSNACPGGSTTVWKRDAPPEVATPEAAAQAEARRQRDQQTVRELSQQVERIQKAAENPQAAPPPPPPVAPPAVDPAAATEPPASAISPELQACRDAQAFADAVREKEWLGLSDDQVRRLFGWVAIQCKVPAGG